MTLRLRHAAALAVLWAWWPASTTAQQPTQPDAFVRDVGPGVAGRLLREALAAPHTVVVAPDTGIVFARGTDVPRTLLVIGGPARIEGRVRGDMIVLGDLVLRPGAVIDGRAIAYGGAVLNSTLAIVRGERFSFRDVGFRATRTSGESYALDYELLSRHTVPTFSLPGVFGLGIPTYDRVDGLSLRVGPEIALDTGRIRIDPTITYRSQLGAIDPALEVTWQPGRRTTIEARAARATLTNDAWMRGDLTNAATTLFSGSDARNYYRADRADLTAARQFETTRAIIAPFVGALVERAWSAARDSLASSRPWSLLGRKDAVEGMRRPNPAVTGGTVASALAGFDARTLTGPISANGTLRLELPVSTTSDAHFAQLTLGGQIELPTFRDQSFQAITHVVFTAGDRPPSQRFAYIGGGPSIPTLALLEQGGDQLLWLESRYSVPIAGVHLPLLDKPPRVVLRHVVGGAGVDRLPALTQNVGLRLVLGFLRLDVVLDPTEPSKHEFGVGLGTR